MIKSINCAGGKAEETGILQLLYCPIVKCETGCYLNIYHLPNRFPHSIDIPANLVMEKKTTCGG